MDEKHLRSIPLFEGLRKRERAAIARCADEIDVPEGKSLVREGEFAYEFFVVESGSAEVTKRGEKISELGPGDFFGEIALMGADRRTASVVATSPMRLIVMFGRDFRQMEHSMPEVHSRIQAAITARMQQ
jgi:CRP/FNR family transcriptional regulator, cyclic AMP receptor protein